MKTCRLLFSVILMMTATVIQAQSYANLPSYLETQIKGVVASTGYDDERDVEVIDFQTYSGVTYGTKIADGQYPIYAIYNIPQKKVTLHTSASGYMAPRDMNYYFNDLRSLKRIDNLNKVNTSNVTGMRMMFYGCRSLTSLDLSNFDTRNVTDMSDMFRSCVELTSLDLSNFYTGNVTDMRDMFCGCRSLTSLDLRYFDTRNVTNMSEMFWLCDKLEYIHIYNNFNTSNVTDMQVMFCGCRSLTSLNLSHFDTRNVTDMHNMFSACENLTYLDLSNFDTRNVTDMSIMFGGCKKLASLDISNFDTSNVTEMKEMFSSSSLMYINAPNKFFAPSGNNFLASNAIVACPASAYKNYKNDSFWGSYQLIKLKPEGEAWTAGDANGDAEVDVADLYHVAKGIMKQADENLYLLPADMNEDKALTVTDYVGVTNVILGTYRANAPRKVKNIDNGIDTGLTARIESDNLLLNLTDVGEFTALQMDVTLPDGLAISDVVRMGNTSHAVTYSNLGNGVWRIMLTSMRNELMQAGDVLNISLAGKGEVADMQLGNVILVQPSMATSKLDALEIGGVATSIDTINGNEMSVSDAYSLSGTKIGAMHRNSGIYIQNGKKFIAK